jgi:acyl carrier protein
VTDVRRSIRAFIAETFVLDGELDDDVSLTETGIIDSTGVLEVIVFLEDRFGVFVPDEDATPEHLDSVSNLARYVSRRVETRRAAATQFDDPVVAAQSDDALFEEVHQFHG